MAPTRQRVVRFRRRSDLRPRHMRRAAARRRRPAASPATSRSTAAADPARVSPSSSSRRGRASTTSTTRRSFSRRSSASSKTTGSAANALGGGSFDATAGNIAGMFDFTAPPRLTPLYLDPELGVRSSRRRRLADNGHSGAAPRRVSIAARRRYAVPCARRTRRTNRARSRTPIRCDSCGPQLRHSVRWRSSAARSFSTRALGVRAAFMRNLSPPAECICVPLTPSPCRASRRAVRNRSCAPCRVFGMPIAPRLLRRPRVERCRRRRHRRAGRGDGHRSWSRAAVCSGTAARTRSRIRRWGRSSTRTRWAIAASRRWPPSSGTRLRRALRGPLWHRDLLRNPLVSWTKRCSPSLAFRSRIRRFIRTQQVRSLPRGNARPHTEEWRGLAGLRRSEARQLRGVSSRPPTRRRTAAGVHRLRVRRDRRSTRCGRRSPGTDLGACGPLRTDLRAQPQFCGMFRTPSLRNTATRLAFFHNGVYRSLEQVLAFYNFRDTRPDSVYARGKFDDLPPAY